MQLVSSCEFIVAIDCPGFFYQWGVHPSDSRQLTVVSHSGQNTFNLPESQCELAYGYQIYFMAVLIQVRAFLLSNAPTGVSWPLDK